MSKKEHLDLIDTWLDECYERARKGELYGTMLEIIKEKDIVKKLKQSEEPIIVQHVIGDKTPVKPLKTKIKEFVVGSK